MEPGKKPSLEELLNWVHDVLGSALAQGIERHIYEIRMEVEVLGYIEGYLRELKDRRDHEQERDHKKKGRKREPPPFGDRPWWEQGTSSNKKKEQSYYEPFRDPSFREYFRKAEEEFFRKAYGFGFGSEEPKTKRERTYDWTDSKTKDPWYVVLGVPAGSNKATIKSAWRKLCKQFHPDRAPDEETRIAWTEKLKEINAAKDRGLDGL